MNDWSHGYNVSMGYVFGFHPEMAPDWMDFCTRVAGFVPRRPERSGPFRYLELGSGQGVGLCLLAAANPGAEFVGVDFLPEHITHAEGLAEAAGLTNVRFVEGDFAALAVDWPNDFGTFDYVALHGIYSWVSTEMRHALVACLRHATRSGSLIYNSYNAQPGWLGTVPFQHITHLLSQSTGQDGRTVADAAIGLFERLRAGNATIFQVLPALNARLSRVKAQDIHYLVQEYLHDNWHIHWHSDVARELAGAKLNYVGSATLAENMLPTLLAPPLRDAIVEQQGQGLKQDLQDIAINQSFRRDLFSRGARRGFRREIDAVSEMRLHLITRPATDGTITVDTAFGEITLVPEAFSEVFGALESGPKTIGELASLQAMQAQGREGAIQILLLLLHSARLGIEAIDAGAPDNARRLNLVLAQAVAKGAPYDHIAAPVLGSAIKVSNAEMLLIDCWLESSGKADAARLAKGLAERLARLGRKLKEDGKDLTGAQAEQRFADMAKRFLEQSLPRWRALGAFA